jgi:hypothetical protein
MLLHLCNYTNLLTIRVRAGVPVTWNSHFIGEFPAGARSSVPL